jgi:hypothetical protein
MPHQVKDIIARMKADAMVEKIQAQVHTISNAVLDVYVTISYAVLSVVHMYMMLKQRDKNNSSKADAMAAENVLPHEIIEGREAAFNCF